MRRLPHSIALALLAHLGGCGSESAPTEPVTPTVMVQPATPVAASVETSPVTPPPAPTSSASGWQISRYDGRDYGFRSIAFDVNSRGPVFALMTRTRLLIEQLSGPLEEVTGTEPHLDLTRASVAFSYAQGGVPHAFFIDTARPGMAYATRTDTAWVSEPVVGGEGLILPRLAFDAQGFVHGAVVDMNAPSVTHVARNEDGTWQTNVAARFTAGATDVCCRLAITPIKASDSVAKASLRVVIGPRSEISSRILARCLPPCSNSVETRLPEF